MQVPRLEDLVRQYTARRDELDRHGAYFLGDITQEEAERFCKTLLLMSIDRQNDPERPIVIYINSGGGSVGAGMAMMEMIQKMRREYRVKINTVITGYAYSMGAIVFQAGEKRTMGFFSTMMLHGGSWVLSGEDEKIFKDYLKLADHYRDMIGALFASRTGLHTGRWWTRFIYSGHDRFLSAGECLKLNLTDGISELTVGVPEPSGDNEELRWHHRR